MHALFFFSLQLLSAFYARNSAERIACIIALISHNNLKKVCFVILSLQMKKLSLSSLKFLPIALSCWSLDGSTSQSGSNACASEYFTGLRLVLLGSIM